MSDLKLPDFLWQHYYGRWINYSVTENRTLNRAAKKWQKSVTVANNDNKHIVVHLDRMYQENLNTTRVSEQNVRCLLYNNGYYSWLYFDTPTAEWRSYTPSLVVFLELAYTRKEDTLKFYENTDFTVNLKTFEEINENRKNIVAVNREEYLKSDSAVEDKYFKPDKNFQELLADQNINLKKRVLSLQSSSSREALSVSNNPSEIDISITTISRSPNIEVEEKDIVNLGVDAMYKDGHKYTLYEEDGFVYTASLSFVNIESNQNKFLIMQLCKHNTNKTSCFVLWSRSGRMGSKGKSEAVKYRDIEKAKEDFKSRFLAKSGEKWEHKNKYCYVRRKYYFVQSDLSPEAERPIREPDFESPLLMLMEAITSQIKVKEVMDTLLYDSGYIPLGRLSFKQLRAGYQALTTIVDTLKNSDQGEQLLTACERFYMIIPHNFGNRQPPVIQTKDDIKQKMDLLESLWHLREEENLLHEGLLTAQHPFEIYYNSFGYFLEHLDRNSPTFASLDRCLQETSGPTHQFKMEICDAFRCNQKGPNSSIDLLESFGCSSNVRLLWHGSRITNWISILSKGLQVAPAEAPSNGSMLGKGIYFADVSSKSANYSLASTYNGEGVLLLCEVTLGNSLEVDIQQNNCCNFENLHKNVPPNFSSVFAEGQYSPVFQKSDLSPIALAPFGPTELKHPSCYLRYNEYVVYTPELVKIKYLLRVRWFPNC